MRAAFLGEKDVLEYLAEKGADINAKDDEGRTALMESVNGYKAEIIQYLVEHGADVNAADNRGCTSLMRAAYIGYPELVKYLLDHGADKEHADVEGNKAIHYVRKECLADLKEILK